MKYLALIILLALSIDFTIAQSKPTDLDKSPLDVSYFPANFPVLKMKGQTVGEPLARIIYSRPQKKGRMIFGEEVKYNEVWRLGANESTELELFKHATIAGKRVAKGRYSLFCIPTENKWTLILSKDIFSWGSFSYNAAKDVARIEVPVQKINEDVEALTMYFDSDSLEILWENMKVDVPLVF